MKRLLFAALGLVLASSVAFAVTDIWPPGQVTNITVTQGKTTMGVTIQFTGDDCGTGTAASYQLIYSTSPITEANYTSATVWSSGAADAPGNFSPCAVKTGLTSGTTYYWAAVMIDDVGLKSLSVVITKATKTSGPEVAC